MHRWLKKFGIALLLAALAACSGGAVDGSGGAVGGLPGGPGANFAEGTLGSQSDIQEMADGCLSNYSLKFSGDSATSAWYILQPGQKNFPSPGLIVRNQKEPVVNEEICTDCAGKTIRVIDFGDPEFKPFNEQMDYSLFMVGTYKHAVKPEIIAQARYQDFTVSAVGDVAFKDLPIALNHVYLLLLSNQVLPQQVSTPTAFASSDEFYAMIECSKKPETHPFQRLRAFQARNSVPGGFPKLPSGGSDDDNVQIQVVPPQSLESVTLPGPPPVENEIEWNTDNTNHIFVKPPEQ